MDTKSSDRTIRGQLKARFATIQPEISRRVPSPASRWGGVQQAAQPV